MEIKQETLERAVEVLESIAAAGGQYEPRLTLSPADEARHTALKQEAANDLEKAAAAAEFANECEYYFTRETVYTKNEDQEALQLFAEYLREQAEAGVDLSKYNYLLPTFLQIEEDLYNENGHLWGYYYQELGNALELTLERHLAPRDPDAWRRNWGVLQERFRFKDSKQRPIYERFDRLKAELEKDLKGKPNHKTLAAFAWLIYEGGFLTSKGKPATFSAWLQEFYKSLAVDAVEYKPKDLKAWPRLPEIRERLETAFYGEE